MFQVRLTTPLTDDWLTTNDLIHQAAGMAPVKSGVDFAEPATRTLFWNLVERAEAEALRARLAAVPGVQVALEEQP